MAKTASALKTELRLGLPGGNGGEKNGKKRAFSEMSSGGGEENMTSVVVGWPPVCTYRRKSIRYSGESKMYVKVGMDGAPYLRKIDLSNHKECSDLFNALEHLFGCFGIGENADAENREYVPIYEDKDGDWMLVGDVPWEMFVESCKRLRIMKKSSNAKGVGL